MPGLHGLNAVSRGRLGIGGEWRNQKLPTAQDGLCGSPASALARNDPGAIARARVTERTITAPAGV